MRGLLVSIPFWFVAITGAGTVSPAGAQNARTAALEKQMAADPADPVLPYFLAIYRARAGNLDGAVSALEHTFEIGAGFLPPADVFPALAADPRFAPLQQKFAAALPRVDDGRVQFVLQDAGLFPEGIAYDPQTQRFYVGSVARRAIFRIRDDGTLEPFSRPDDGLEGVLGLAVDAARRRLYAATSTVVNAVGRSTPRNAVAVYDLEHGKLVSQVDLPGAVQINDLAVNPNGSLVITDSGGSGVWWAHPDSSTVRALVPLGQLHGANGVAIPPQGGVAYVAASRGVMRLDLATGAMQRLPMPPRENAAAIDGLYWSAGSLIGVQNATTPARVVRLQLDAAEAAVEALQTLQSHHQKAFDEPTTGAVAPGGFYVLATTQMSRFQPDGTIDRPESVTKPAVLRVPLDPGPSRR